MDNDEARAMLEGGPGRPAGHVADVPEGMGPFSFGSPWSGLAKLAEEAGELVTVIGKLMATGGHPTHWQGDLIPSLIEEMGDTGAALDHTLEHGLHITHDHLKAYEIRYGLKARLFAQWALEGKRNRDEADAAWAGPDGP